MTTLAKKFVSELRDIYDGEKQLVEALPKLAAKASDGSLREAIEKHLEETRGHVERLEKVFDQLGERRSPKTCKGIQGLLEEGESAIKGISGAVRDATMIAGAQKVEHYEIATYGTLRTWARELGHDDVAGLLDDTLDEESHADETLTKIAEGRLFESGVNQAAARR